MLPDAIPPTVIEHVDAVRDERSAADIPVAANGVNYVVKGVTLLSRAKIAEAVTAAPTPEVAVARIKAAYLQSGYFLVAPQLGGQSPNYEIQVVEGRISELAVPKGLEPFFRPLAGRRDLTAAELERAAALAQAYTVRQGWQPQVSGFTPAADPGTTRITVAGQPMGDGFRTTDLGFGFGNQGDRYTGRFLGSASANLRPGNGIEISAAYSHGFPRFSEASQGGSYDSYSLGGSMVRPSGIYSLSIASSSYQLGEAFAPSFPEGRFSSVIASAAQLLKASDSVRLTLSEALTTVVNKAQAVIAGKMTPTADERFTFGSLAVNGTRTLAPAGRNGTASFGLKLSYELGQPGAGSAVTPNPNEAKRFAVANLQMAIQQELPGGFEVNLQLAGQTSRQPVPQYLQWTLGGSGNLSAWMPGTIYGDRGSVGRLSLASPKLQAGPFELRANLFGEYGHVSVVEPVPGIWSSAWLSDYGVGFAANARPGTQISLESARPFGSGGAADDYLYRQRAHYYFNLTQKF